MTGYSRGEAPDWLNVSRETLAHLDEFLALVEKWQPAINLIAKGTIPVAWERHVLDSAQLFEFSPDTAAHWVDFGSGGGFPGIVVAIIAREKRPGLKTTLVEADKRKAAFLMQAARQLGLTVSMVTDRAEALAPLAADVVSARALAALPDLCALAAPHLNLGGVAIFPKGRHAEVELAAARLNWRFDASLAVSKTDSTGRIVTLTNLNHV